MEFIMPETGAAHGQAMTHPDTIVIVDKEKMSQFGELDFTVFKQHGSELGKATYYITAYSDKNRFLTRKTMGKLYFSMFLDRIRQVKDAFKKAGRMMKMLKHNLAGKLVIVLMGIILVSSFSGCDFIKEKIVDFKLPKGTELDFEIPKYTIFRAKEYIEFQLYVITEKAITLPEHMKWLSPESQDRFLSIDYSRYFLLQIEMGPFGSTGFSFDIKRIWQDKNNIYIKSEFTKPEPGAAYGQAITLPGDIALIDKNKMPQFGELDFTVFDQNGVELGKAKYYIPTYSDKK
jgi:hypothetical protein